jgi:hypothetical protein
VNLLRESSFVRPSTSESFTPFPTAARSARLRSRAQSRWSKVSGDAGNWRLFHSRGRAKSAKFGRSRAANRLRGSMFLDQWHGSSFSVPRAFDSCGSGRRRTSLRFSSETHSAGPATRTRAAPRSFLNTRTQI